MSYSLKLKTAPASEPISTADAKTHMVVEHALDDTYIDSLVKAARIKTEEHLNRALITQTWTLKLDAFPVSSKTPIKLPFSPLQSVSFIKYVDTDGVLQTWDSSLYTVDTESEPARIIPAYNESWPTIRNQIQAVQIEFVAGYGNNASDVPESIILAMKALIAHWYANRATVSELSLKEIPIGFKWILKDNRIREF